MLGGGGPHGLEKGFEQPPEKALPGWQPGLGTSQNALTLGTCHVWWEPTWAPEPHSPGVCVTPTRDTVGRPGAI